MYKVCEFTEIIQLFELHPAGDTCTTTMGMARKCRSSDVFFHEPEKTEILIPRNSARTRSACVYLNAYRKKGNKVKIV